MKNSIRYSVLLLYGVLAALPASAQPAPLPDAWLGEWHGSMVNLTPSDTSAAIPVQLRLTRLPDGVYQFRTVYNDDEQLGLRDYRLIPDDRTAGRFILDEQNGIRLHAQLIAGELITSFQVGDQALVSRYAINQDDQLVHDILFWSTNEPLVTTGTGIAGEGGQPVHTFMPVGVQRTVFSKQLR
ncbi:MAG: hypothetical protein RhofKO_18080 [Rhodothermales bacterium]